MEMSVGESSQQTGGCGVHVVGGSSRHGGAAVAAVAPVVPPTLRRCAGEGECSSRCGSFSWHRVTHALGGRPDLTSQRAIKKMPLSLSSCYSVLFINLETILWQVVVTSGKMSWVLKVKLHKVLKL